MPRSSLLRWNLAYLVMVVLHDVDHIRQGRDLATELNALGGFALAGSILATLLAATGNRFAPPFSALLGFAGAAGLVAVHVLPHWSVFSDPYAAANVDALSWLMIAATFVTGVGLGIAGTRAMQPASPA